MKMLMERALEFCTNKPAMHPFTHVYRCKPSIYWRDIEHRTNRIMIKYIKDENGQAASPINGVIYGLFFSARLLMSGMLPQSSPFGDVRMVMPAALLLDPDLYNLYFSDFCMFFDSLYRVIIYDSFFQIVISLHIMLR